MKTVDEIYQEMLAAFGEKTGLTPSEGCDLAARFYACAAQVYGLYIQADWVVRQAFPQSAEGEYLDRHAQLRGLERKLPVPARGVVRFSSGAPSETDRTIPKGTVCMTSGLIRFETTEEGILAAGAAYADIPVCALMPGSSGNVAAGAIQSMTVAPTGVASCTNPLPCRGGVDREEDAALRSRVMETFRRLPNGANAAFYEQEALSFDQVAAAAVIPKPRGVGTLDVVVSTHQGLPDQSLLEELTDYFQSRREIAVEVRVRSPRTKTIDISVKIAPQPGRTPEQILTAVENVIREWFDGRRLGQDVLLAQLGDLIYRCDGVANYTILSPSADTSVEVDELPVLGGLTVEGMT